MGWRVKIGVATPQNDRIGIGARLSEQRIEQIGAFFRSRSLKTLSSKHHAVQPYYGGVAHSVQPIARSTAARS